MLQAPWAVVNSRTGLAVSASGFGIFGFPRPESGMVFDDPERVRFFRPICDPAKRDFKRDSPV